MTMGRISTYGFSLNMISKNTSLQKQLAMLQEQIATKVKSPDLKGYGVDSLRLQNARVDNKLLEGYMYNIQTSTVKIKQMTTNVKEAQKHAENVMDAINLIPAEGDIDIKNVKAMAENARNIIMDLMNDKNGDDYLFSGTDVKNKPLENTSTLTTRVQNQMTNFLDGTISVDQFLDNVNNYTDSQIGFSMGVQSSSSTKVRADDNFEVDYTATANDEGFKNLLVNLTVLAEMEMPDPNVDMASRDDFYTAMNTIYSRLQESVTTMRETEVKLSSAEATIGRKLENHKEDSAFLMSVVENIQEVDPAEAVIKFQALQTQLEASFQATAIISSLSLARML